MNNMTKNDNNSNSNNSQLDNKSTTINAIDKHELYPHPILAKEGWFYIILSLVLSALVYKVSNFWVALPFFLISIFIIQFFRDPKRNVPLGDNLILSPADGKVICIEPTYDVYQNKDALKVSIFMNVFNVHSNRSPALGEIVDMKYFAGKFVNADFDKASTENERNAMVLQLPNQHRITVVQIAGLVARRILCYTRTGNWLRAGERYGFIRFGSRVDLYLPLDYQPMVTLGQKVKATETIIAKFEE
jgi:phosphatidylserine decarboxylase